MKQRTVSGLVLWLAMTGSVALGQAGDSAVGKELYERRCGSCHLPSGEPRDAIEKAMNVDMRHLGSEEVQAKDNEALKKDVVEGTGKMRPVRNMDDKALTDLISYLRSLVEE